MVLYYKDGALLYGDGGFCVKMSLCYMKMVLYLIQIVLFYMNSDGAFNVMVLFLNDCAFKCDCAFLNGGAF